MDGSRVVAAAARRAGARLVHVSSVDAIGLRADGLPADEDTPPGGIPECPYVVTKRDAEWVVHDEIARGLDAVIVNPVYMLGPWDWKPSSGRMLLEVGSGKVLRGLKNLEIDLRILHGYFIRRRIVYEKDLIILQNISRSGCWECKSSKYLTSIYSNSNRCSRIASR